MVAEKVSPSLNEAKKFLKEIQEKLGTHVISIVYNPYGGGIGKPHIFSKKEDDSWYLWSAIEKSGLKKSKVILHGQGGDFKVGIKMAYAFRKGLDNYETIVPSICCSALCLSLLRSDSLLITENTYVTQIDPLYEENEQLIRAVDNVFSKDDERRLKSKRILSDCKKIIINLLKEKPSLYNHRKEEWEDIYDTEKIAEKFMYKSDHYEPLSYKELLELNLKVKLVDDKELIDLMKEYVEICQRILVEESRRIIIGCSKDYFLYDNGVEGNFLRLK